MIHIWEFRSPRQQCQPIASAPSRHHIQMCLGSHGCDSVWPGDWGQADIFSGSMELESLSRFISHKRVWTRKERVSKETVPNFTFLQNPS